MWEVTWCVEVIWWLFGGDLVDGCGGDLVDGCGCDLYCVEVTWWVCGGDLVGVWR